MRTLLEDLGLESVAIALEESLDNLNRLSRRITSVRGVSQGMALEAEQLMPGFLKPSRPIGYFSATPSKSQYRVSLEEISRGMWAAIAVAIAAAFAAVITLIFALVGGDSSSSSGRSGGADLPGLEKALKANDEALKAHVAASSSTDAIAKASGEELKALEEALTAHFSGTHVAQEDMASHAHTGLAHFSQLDVDMLNQHGLYAFLKSDENLAPTANTMLKIALADSNRIADEFDRSTPDYKSVAAAIVRLRENRVVGQDWDEGLAFAEYVQMLVNHREANADKPLEIKRLSDFTAMSRAFVQHGEKSCDFFKDLLKRNGDILENLAHDAKTLAKRHDTVRHGVSGPGTEEDSKALVQESQKFIMQTCKSLRALGSYVHLTIWSAQRHAKFVMFLSTSLRQILIEARTLLKSKGHEVPEYFNDAIKSLEKKK